MPVGYGSTGRCFKSNKPNIALFREDWGCDLIEDEEQKKVDPDLRWIISIPILGGSNGVRTIWVLNVDGIKDKKGEDELQQALNSLVYWSHLITVFIAKGYNKGEYNEIEEYFCRS